MNRELAAVFVLIFMIGVGAVLACEPPQPPVTPTGNTSCTNITNNVNSESQSSSNSTSTAIVNNTNNNNNTNINQNNNTQSQSQSIENNFNPQNNFNPVIVIQTSNNQLLDVEVDQSQKQENWPAVLEVGAITPYGKIVSIKPQDENENLTKTVNTGSQTTGGFIPPLLIGGGLVGLGLVGAGKAGWLAKLGY